jgi:hypothetical protein
MPSKRIEIVKKVSNHFISVKVSLKCYELFKKSLEISKKNPRGYCRIATMASPSLTGTDEQMLMMLYFQEVFTKIDRTKFHIEPKKKKSFDRVTRTNY